MRWQFWRRPDKTIFWLNAVPTNSIDEPLFVVELPNGEVVADPGTGHARILSPTSVVGLDPQDIPLIREGVVKQVQLESEISAYFSAMTQDYERTLDRTAPLEGGRLFTAVEFTVAATRAFGGRMAC